MNNRASSYLHPHLLL
uniref:Uncharacterized protein n=1 Tax=Rhizophora mucronata TaxID=61149 RepID=A0A2P2R3Z3_RHIMU